MEAGVRCQTTVALVVAAAVVVEEEEASAVQSIVVIVVAEQDPIHEMTTMVAVQLYCSIEDQVVVVPKVVVSQSDLISFVDDTATIVAVPQLLLYYYCHCQHFY